MVEECLGVALLGAALLSTLALATYTPTDPVFERTLVSNRAGVIGATLAALLLRGLGSGALVGVAAAAVVGVRLLAGWGLAPVFSRFWVGATLLLISVASLPPLVAEASQGAVDLGSGGHLGTFLASHQTWLVGNWGALLLNGVFLCVGLLGATGVSSSAALSVLGRGLGWLAGAFGGLVVGAGRGLVSMTRGVRAALAEVGAGFGRGLAAVVVWREQRARRARMAQVRAPLEPLAAGSAQEAVAIGAGRRRAAGDDPTIVDHSVELEPKPVTQENFDFDDRQRAGPYELPSIEIFGRPPEGRHTYDRESLIMNSRILEKKLMDFGVGGRVVTVHPGPVVTMYEFEPASGVKVNRITGLSDDLALALRALSVRIIAPLPAKSVVGIEVANAQREVVYLREVLESDALRADASKLTFALGKDIFGNPAHADLAKMPHLLVAGATGTGKSVFLNSLLCSLLYRATADDLKLLLIDPKLLELSIYEGIPHLIADVVTNPKRAAAALNGIVHKMEERYQMMAALGVRSIAQYNERVEKAAAEGVQTFRLKAKPGEEEGEEIEFRRLPYILVVIDELADLMVVSARDVEEALQRLAQMARAAGIHLVLATQRPSVDVLTGVIKANFPARVSFQVSSRTDSRTILDQNGADNLLGQGDLLFLPPGTSKLQRMHGAYVSEAEVADLVAFLREQGAPEFDEDLLRLPEDAESGESSGEEVDEMYDRALAIVAESRNASISYIQRRLKVGYNRAARMIEYMENEGVVGPQVGTKSREVFISAIEP
jgi:S-DNA-T family DNA segregation ATPase FtsK/SpoIIIE